MRKIPLVVILGPTAVGKTEISIRLAEDLGGEIISADSRLFYRGMDIGTAKPTTEELSRVPHHLIDVANPDQSWSLAQFQREVYRLIEYIHKSGKQPFLVGGTGQYIKAIVDGWVIPEVSPNLKMRKVIETWEDELGEEKLHQIVEYLDPEAAQKIEPTNVRRSIRALEVIFTTGKLFSSQKRAVGSRYRILQLGLIRPRDELYQRIDARIEQMLDKGFENEVRSLLKEGYTIDDPPMSAIGYRQMIKYIEGDISLAETVIQIKRFTRQYVRRQANWFKPTNTDIDWFNVDDDIYKNMKERILDFVNENRL